MRGGRVFFVFIHFKKTVEMSRIKLKYNFVDSSGPSNPVRGATDSLFITASLEWNVLCVEEQSLQSPHTDDYTEKSFHCH